jgi:hypothetical protein
VAKSPQWRPSVTAFPACLLAGFAGGEVVALADIVEAEQLQHHVVERIPAGGGKGDAVVARVHVEEIQLIGPQEIVAETESEDVAVELHHLLDPLHMQDHMAESERPGAEPGNIASGHERVGRRLGAMEEFEPVAEGIADHQEIGDPAFLGECPDRLDAVAVEMRPQPVERGGVGHFPAEKADAFAAVGVHDQPLLAVVHAQRQRGAGAVHRLRAEQPRPVARPVLDVLGAKADIAERLNQHTTPLRAHRHANLSEFSLALTRLRISS